MLEWLERHEMQQAEGLWAVGAPHMQQRIIGMALVGVGVGAEATAADMIVNRWIY